MHLPSRCRLRPFSHLPGTSVVLPGSAYRATVYPCLIRIDCLRRAAPASKGEIRLNFGSPVIQFTVLDDLERGKITVSGTTSQASFRYHLIYNPVSGGIRLTPDRAPPDGITVLFGEKSRRIFRNDRFDFFGNESSFVAYEIVRRERLFLGSHKAQDIDLISRRLDLREIFPLWYRAGKSVYAPDRSIFGEGTTALLKECEEHIRSGKPEEGNRIWQNLLLAGFEGILSPRLSDRDYRGILSDRPVENADLSPLILLTEGASLIEKLFIDRRENALLILPRLLPEFAFGSLIEVDLGKLGTIGIEWTKKTVRRCVLRSEINGSIDFDFRSNVRSYRLRRSDRDPGERLKTEAPLSVEQNTVYFFDNFM